MQLQQPPPRSSQRSKHRTGRQHRGPTRGLTAGPQAPKSAAFKLSEITGSGPGGLILRADVLAAESDATAPAAAQPAASKPLPPLSAPVTAGEVDGRTGLRTPGVTRSRRARRVVEAMTTSRREIPEATVWLDRRHGPHPAACRTEGRHRYRTDPAGLVGRYVLAGPQRYPS